VWRLAAGVVVLGRNGLVEVLEGVWRLAA